MLYRFIPLYRLYRILMFKSHFLFRNNFGDPSGRAIELTKNIGQDADAPIQKLYTCVLGGGQDNTTSPGILSYVLLPFLIY